MNLFQWQHILWLAALLAVAPGARAQSGPHIGYIYPAGGQQGTAFEVMVGGQRLDDVSEIYVSGGGLKATAVKHTKPLTPRQRNEQREKLRELRKKVQEEMRNRRARRNQGGGNMAGSGADTTDWLTGARMEMAQMRKMFFDPKKQPNSQIAESVVLHITLAPDAEPGEREIRLKGKFGLSNPLCFRVGQLPEHREQEPNDTAADTGSVVPLPAVLNGQIMPGDIDRFRFRARKGERLVAATGARELIPYLADAVPGWFQAVLTLYDANGTEVAYADDYRFHPDPVVFCDIPADGEYVLEIRDAIYRGRQDFVYRIALGELPFVTDVFPLGARAGTRPKVEVEGCNLSEHQFRPDIKGKDPGTHQVSVRAKKKISNSVPFAVDTLPERLEKEPNNTLEKAQRISLPMIVNGRIDVPDDWDVFRFVGRKGDEIVAEVHARRLNTPLDAVLRLTDSAGRELVANDDSEDRASGLTTHHADPRLSIRLPADGAYDLHVGDTQRQGGPACAYRLRVSPPQPDFELRAVPASINLRAGSTMPLTVYALRKDGFSGEVTLELSDPPQGFILSGGRIPAHQDGVRLTLTAPSDLLDKPVSLTLQGRAVIQGREVCHTAVPAEEMTQAFAYRHLVPTKALMACMTGRRRGAAPIVLLGETPVRLNPHRTTEVRIRVPGRLPLEQLRLELSDPPEGISLVNMRSVQRRIHIVLQTDAEKAQPGLEGNLIVDAFLERAVESKDGTQKARIRRIPLGVLPAIPFEIGQQ